MSTPPNALFKVIANGNSKAGDKLYLTLVATPAGDGANLEKWPRLIREMLATGKVDLKVHRQDDATSEKDVTSKARYDAYGKTADKPWGHVYDLWKETFKDPTDQVFSDLAKDILKSLDGKKRDVTVGDGGALQPPELHPNGDIKGKLHAANSSSENLLGILSVQQTHYASQDQAIRAARVLKKLHRGPDWFVDTVEVGEESADEAKPTNDHVENAQALARNRISALIGKTQPQRGFGLDCFKVVVALLKRQSAKALTFPQLPRVHPAEEPDSGVDRATHEYYTLAQRNETFGRVDQGGIQQRPKESTKTSRVAEELFKGDKAQEKLEKARATFYAIQGDPVLSRLFGLTIDVEINTSDLPPPANDLSNATVDYILHFSVPSSFGTIGTAARLEKQGSRVSFWPVSIFDALMKRPTAATRLPELDSDLNTKLDLLSEQRNGLFRVGQWLPDGAPRYSMSSLDVRYSTETKVKTTHHAAKAKPRDRGEQLPSAGMLVLDRGRTIQVARDLALFKWDKEWTSETGSFAGAPEGWRMLYAEQLTIGRRADVAVARRDDPADSLQWRSLMRRATNFDFGPNDKDVEKLLRLLLPGNGNDALAEEIYFQNAVRQLPVKNQVGVQTEDGIEAVCEEIVFQWAGTPKGVDVNGSKELTSVLPFARMLTLPQGQSGGKLRPPPLRFGTPYLVRFRAVYIGGGSPGDEEANTVASTSKEYILPSAPAKPNAPAMAGGSENPEIRVSPRRFLRHEAIRQPTLLLPHHLADRKLGKDGRMGFERLEHAIVRSETQPQRPIDDAIQKAQEKQDENVIRGKYITAKERAVPLQTMRIVLPPEAAPELVERHGEFDQNAARVERGAFSRVAYVPRRKRPDPAVKTAAFGFPFAVERRLDALELEGVLSTREIVFPRDNSGGTPVTGIPVFWPGASNLMAATNPPPNGRIGYLPDPAAEMYVVRMRRRGTRIYLNGYRDIDVYPKNRYPDAIPLALHVKQRRETNPEPMRIEDIVSPPRLMYLDKAGELKSADTADTSPVQVVEIALGPYEDYDVDVVCLPKHKRFALEFAMPETIAQQLQSMSPKADIGLGKTAEDFAKDIKKAEANTTGYTGLLGQQALHPAALEPLANHLLNVYRNSWPLEEIAAALTFRVCHARNAPEIAPVWSEDIKIERQTAPGPQSATAQKERVPEVLVNGKIELNLDQLDAFEIIARIPAADGSAIDNPKRKRSSLSLRSGRWPRRLSNELLSDSVPTAKEEPIPVRDVYGFDVFTDRTVRLPREEVVLLRVANLPQPGTYGRFYAVSKVPMYFDEDKLWLAEKREPLKDLLKGSGRHVIVDLNQVFKAAIDGKEIVYELAQPNDDVIDRDAKPIRLTVERPYRIKDALARGIDLRVVGIGRQAMLFETAPVYLNDPDQSYFRRQPLKAKDQSISSARTAATLFVPGTRRPNSCHALRPEPAFQFENKVVTNQQDGNVGHQVSRDALCRIWLERSWATSGEGERLGLVLWPPKYADLTETDVDDDSVKLDHRTRDGMKGPVKISDFEDQDLGEAGAFITRWGGDPTRRDRAIQFGFLIPPHALSDLKAAVDDTGKSPHKPKYIASISMPVARGSNSVATTEKKASNLPKEKELAQVNVSLLTYEPCFDPDREQWYVDINIRPNRASEPFVRFGLVRYQPNAAEAIQVSEPVSVMMQMLAGRKVTLSVSADNDGGFVSSFRVTGRGAKSIPAWSGDLKPAAEKNYDTWLKAAEELDMPKLRVHYFHERLGEDGYLRRRPLVPIGKQGAEGEHSATFSGDDICFDFERRFSKEEITPLARLGKGQIVAYLEEVHRFMPASYRREPIPLDTMFDRRTFVDTGPRFSARVEILDTGPADVPPPGAMK